MPHYNVLASVVQTLEAPTVDAAVAAVHLDLMISGFEVYDSGEAPIPHTPHAFEVEPGLGEWAAIARDADALLRALYAS